MTETQWVESEIDRLVVIPGQYIEMWRRYKPQVVKMVTKMSQKGCMKRRLFWSHFDKSLDFVGHFGFCIRTGSFKNKEKAAFWVQFQHSSEGSLWIVVRPDDDTTGAQTWRKRMRRALGEDE